MIPTLLWMISSMNVQKKFNPKWDTLKQTDQEQVRRHTKRAQWAKVKIYLTQISQKYSFLVLKLLTLEPLTKKVLNQKVTHRMRVKRESLDLFLATWVSFQKVNLLDLEFKKWIQITPCLKNSLVCRLKLTNKIAKSFIIKLDQLR